MDGYQEKSNSVAVPKSTGIDGFLKTLRSILSLPRVQSISIDARGTVNYTRYVKEGESEGPLNVDYAGLQPWNIIRNGNLDELQHHSKEPASNVVATLFNRVAREGLTPVAFATGINTCFWKWHEMTAGIELVKTSSAYGLPIYTDRQLPDYRLVICAGYVRSGLVDCHRFIMANMSSDVTGPETNVDIL